MLLGKGVTPNEWGERWACASLTSTLGIKAFARGRHAIKSLCDRDWRSVFVC